MANTSWATICLPVGHLIGSVHSQGWEGWSTSGSTLECHIGVPGQDGSRCSFVRKPEGDAQRSDCSEILFFFLGRKHAAEASPCACCHLLLWRTHGGPIANQKEKLVIVPEAWIARGICSSTLYSPLEIGVSIVERMWRNLFWPFKLVTAL